MLLENFKGVWSGTGKTKIEIFFKSPSSYRSRIFLIMGENGSGKSTFLTMLHPFAESFDNRNDSMIRENTTGKKEIDFKNGKNIYKIKHYYTKTKKTSKTKSFISKNDVELNDNGGVITFKQIILEEFGLEESFFKVGRLASTTANFVTLSPGLRKDFIIKHLPDISKYLDAFKIVKEKWSESEKNIKYLSNEISRFDKKEILLDKFKNLRSSLKISEKDVIRIEKRLAVIDNKLEEYRKKENIGEIEATAKEKEIFEQSLKETESALVKTVKKYSILKNIKTKDLKKKIISFQKLETKLEEQEKNLTKEYKKLKEAYVKTEKEMKEKETEISSVESIDETEEGLREIERVNNIEQATITKNQKKLIEKIGSDNIDKFLNLKPRSEDRFLVNKLINELESLLTNLFEYNIGDKTFQLIEKDLADNTYLKSIIETLLKNINTIQTNKIEKKEKEKLKLSKIALSQDLFDKRPEECEIDSCVFVIEGKKGKIAADKECELEEEIDELYKLKEGKEKKLAHINEILELTNYVRELFRLINLDTKENKILFIIKKNLKENSKSSLKLFQFILDKGQFIFNISNKVDNYFDYFSNKSIISEKKNSLKLVVMKLKLLKDNTKFLDSIVKSIKSFEKELKAIIDEGNEVKNVLKDCVEKKDKNSNDLLTLIEYKEKLEYKENLITDIEEDQKILEGNKKELEKLKIFTEEKEQEEILLEEKNEIKNLNEKNVNDINVKIQKLEEYEERYKTFQENFVKETLVKNACDPKKGIPLVFIRDFLEKIEKIANNLFDLAFKGKFRISFQITEKEFRIPVLKEDGEILDDVKYASDGERALIKTIVSLALLSLFVGNYPILALDEIDSVLDKNHRSNFANIIDSQIREILLQQVFIISHNESFRDESINVILFPGHTLSSFEKNTIVKDFTK